MNSIDFIDEAGREWAHASRYRALEDENAALRKRVEEAEGVAQTCKRDHAGLREFLCGNRLSGASIQRVEFDCGPQEWMGQDVGLIAMMVRDNLVALRKRVEELEISAGSAAMTIRMAQARAEKAELELFRAIPVYEEALTLARERAGKAEARVAAYEDALSREMPTDMKDWWQNSKEEWPEIARWVLENRRKRMEQAEAERDRALDSLASYQASAHNYVLKQQENAKLQADLAAALLVCEVLGVEYGRAWLSEEARKAGEHVAVLLEKRRVERG